jgi:hypothetical protein
MERVYITFIILFVSLSCTKEKEEKCTSSLDLKAPTNIQLTKLGLVDNSVSCHSFTMITKEIGYVLVSNNKGGFAQIYKTEDGAKNWAPLINSTVVEYPMGMAWKNQNEGIMTVQDITGCPTACQYKCVAYTTNDGGNTWSRHEYSNLKGTLNVPQYDSSGDLYAETFVNKQGDLGIWESKSGLVKSIDEGSSWTIINNSNYLSLGEMGFKLIGDHLYAETNTFEVVVLDKSGTLVKVIPYDFRLIKDIQQENDGNLIINSNRIHRISPTGKVIDTLTRSKSLIIDYKDNDRTLTALTYESECNEYYTNDIMVVIDKSGQVINKSEQIRGGLSRFKGRQRINDSSLVFLLIENNFYSLGL